MLLQPKNSQLSLFQLNRGNLIHSLQKMVLVLSENEDLLSAYQYLHC